MERVDQEAGNQNNEAAVWHKGFLKFANWVVEHNILGQDKKEKIVISGNPAVGDVTFFRQAHRVQNLDANVKIAVGLYQSKVFQELSNCHFDAIFSENPHCTEPEYLEDVKKHIERDFPAPFDASNPTFPQLQCLYEFGADVVYAVMNRDVQLLGTQNQQLISITSLIQSIASPQHHRAGKLDPVTLYARERYTALEIRKYMEEHKGAKIALVYGARHGFRFDFKRDLPIEGSFSFLKQFGERKRNDVPVLREVMFPKAFDLIDLAHQWDYGDIGKIGSAVLKTILGTSRLSMELDRRRDRIRKSKPAMQRNIDGLLQHFLAFEKDYGNVSFSDTVRKKTEEPSG